MQVHSVIVTILASACALVVGCGDDFPKPDLDLAREVRAGSPAACVRTSAWIKSHLRGAMWDRDPVDIERPDRGEIKVTVDTPGLIGVTPSEAVMCDVRVMVGEGDGVVTGFQSYQIALGDDFGPDFARFRFIDAGVIPEYAAARAALSGGAMEWAEDTLPCSRQTPGMVPLKSTTGEQTLRAARALAGRAREEQIALPAWVTDRIQSMATLGETRIYDEIYRFGAVCGPLGCDRQALGFAVPDRRWNAEQQVWTVGIPTGVLRTRAEATSQYVYRAFGHTRSTDETCAFNVLTEADRFLSKTVPVTTP